MIYLVCSPRLRKSSSITLTSLKDLTGNLYPILSMLTPCIFSGKGKGTEQLFRPKSIHFVFLAFNVSLISHHNKASFHRKGQSSCLDHIYSNCHTRIRNVAIEKDILSDHKIITCSYNNKKLNLSTTYTTRRDYSLITSESLLHYLNMTNNIDQVFNTDNPNTIAEIIQSI